VAFRIGVQRTDFTAKANGILSCPSLKDFDSFRVADRFDTVGRISALLISQSVRLLIAFDERCEVCFPCNQQVILGRVLENMRLPHC